MSCNKKSKIVNPRVYGSLLVFCLCACSSVSELEFSGNGRGWIIENQIRHMKAHPEDLEIYSAHGQQVDTRGRYQVNTLRIIIAVEGDDQAYFQRLMADIALTAYGGRVHRLENRRVASVEMVADEVFPKGHLTFELQAGATVDRSLNTPNPISDVKKSGRWYLMDGPFIPIDAGSYESAEVTIKDERGRIIREKRRLHAALKY